MRYLSGPILFLLIGISSASMALTFDQDLPGVLKAQLLRDLSFVSHIKVSPQTELHQQIFGKAQSSSYKTFFDSRISGVGYDTCGGGGAVACVQLVFRTDKLWLTDNFIRFNHPQIARIMVVYHEARHSEMNAGNWIHATCPVPFKDERGNDITSIWTGTRLEGDAACDKTAFGSYGSSTIMLKNVSLFCANCTEKVKMDAGLYADNQLDRIIDSSAKTSLLEDFNGRATGPKIHHGTAPSLYTDR